MGRFAALRVTGVEDPAQAADRWSSLLLGLRATAGRPSSSIRRTAATS